MRILLDTNIIGRLYQPNDKRHKSCVEALEKLPRLGYTVSLVPQVIYEFWVVATRPADNRGFGFSPEYAEQEINKLREMFLLLKDERSIFDYWVRLVSDFNVLGRNAHDARLVAAMNRHNISHLLTLDQKDFKRFKHITIWTPADVAAMSESK